jgi:predicted dehydrogenase
MKSIRVAVLGMNHGFKFANDIVRLPDVELVAVAGNDKISEKRARELNAPLYRDYLDLLNDCTLDGVIITLPNHLHKAAAEACAQRGIHILVEKPIADTVENAETIIKVCSQNQIKLLVGHHRRYSSQMKLLKEVISSGKIGRLVAVNMMWVLAKDRPYFKESWRVTEGGGPLLINSIHDIDNFRYVTGLSIESVYAAVRNSIRKNPVEDSASIILEAKEGATINYFVSDGVPAPWSYEFNLKENPKYVHYNENCYYFFGTKGSLAFPSFKMYSYDEKNYGWEHQLVMDQLTVEENDPMTAELLHFIDMIRGQAEPFVTGEDALETFKVLNAIRESGLKGKKIYL